MKTILLITLSKKSNFAETEVSVRIANTILAKGFQARIVSFEEILAGESFNNENILFSITLHASIPKLLPITSYLCIWDPWCWLKTGKYLQNLLTHDDYLLISPSLQLPTLSSLLKKVIPQESFSFECLPPSVSHASCIPPQKRLTRKLFYCGIGGENIFHRITRLKSVLHLLDKTQHLDLYGPTSILGPQGLRIAPWEGYQSYQGEIPFDGDCLIKTMALSGVSFVVSSHTHREAGLPSARIFEACASGNVIIADETAFFDAWGESIYRISFDRTDEEVANNILRIMQEIFDDPDSAYQKAKAAQDFFVRNYALDVCVENLLTSHEGRVSFQRNYVKAKKEKNLRQIVYQFLKITDCPGVKLKLKYLADKYNLTSLYRLNQGYHYLRLKWFKRVI